MPIDTKQLIASGFLTSRSRKLQIIYHHVTHYNSLGTVGSTSNKLATLESIMEFSFRYLTYKPPATRKNTLRLAAMENLMSQVLEETNKLGLKSLHTTTQMKTIGSGKEDDVRADPTMSYWLEKLSHLMGGRTYAGHDLSDVFRQWARSYNKATWRGGRDKGERTFWDFLSDEAANPDAAPLYEVTYLKNDAERDVYKISRKGHEPWYSDFTDYQVSTIGRGDEDFGGKNFMMYVANFLGEIYIKGHEEGFHHSSFLAGSAVLAAGTILIRYGRIRIITAMSGHYRPTAENMQTFCRVANIDATAGVQPWATGDRKGEYYRVGDFLKDGPAIAQTKKLNELEIARLKIQMVG